MSCHVIFAFSDIASRFSYSPKMYLAGSLDVPCDIFVAVICSNRYTKSAKVRYLVVDSPERGTGSENEHRPREQ